MTVCRIGLDTAKRVFQVHALDEQGRTVTTRRLRRTQVLDWFARLDRANGCVVGLEASGGTHYWARQFRRLGYRVRLLNPQPVKPYRQGQKTDARDTLAHKHTRIAWTMLARGTAYQPPEATTS